MYPVVNEEECIACGTCEDVCPADPNVYEVNEVAEVVEPEACIECEACVEECPVECIALEE